MFKMLHSQTRWGFHHPSLVASTPEISITPTTRPGWQHQLRKLTQRSEPGTQWPSFETNWGETLRFRIFCLVCFRTFSRKKVKVLTVSQKDRCWLRLLNSAWISSMVPTRNLLAYWIYSQVCSMLAYVSYVFNRRQRFNILYFPH